MPAPIPVPVRQMILRRLERGASVVNLAEELELSERTVRHLVRRLVERGPSGVNPDYARCATKTAVENSTVHANAVQLRKQHPSWGAGLIRVLLKGDGGACPSERTLQRWFRDAELSPAPVGRRKSSNEARARRPHQVCQMDAAEQILLASGQRVSWLRFADECSGAVLKTAIFPPTILGPGRSHRRATNDSRVFFHVGIAECVPSRQRHALGIGGRLAYRPGFVVDRPGRRRSLEPTQVSARQRRDRTVARHRQTLGRTRNVC